MKRDWSLLKPDKIKNSTVLNLADLNEMTTAEGPGRRFAIWLQGCPIRCVGCWNRDMWSMKKRHLVDVKKLLNYVREYEERIDGVTILGGEPLVQATPLSEFVKLLKGETNLSVMLYTGYELTDIKDPHSIWLVENCDIVVLGPFKIELKKDGLKWKGSENQYIKINDPAYEKYFLYEDELDVVEITFNKQNMEVTIIGYPDETILKSILRENM